MKLMITLVAKNTFSLFHEAFENLKAEGTPVVKATNLDDAMKQCEYPPYGVIAINFEDANSIKNQINTVMQLKQFVDNKLIFLIAITPLNSPDVFALLKRVGFEEILANDLKLKGFKLKLNKATKITEYRKKAIEKQRLESEKEQQQVAALKRKQQQKQPEDSKDTFVFATNSTNVTKTNTPKVFESDTPLGKELEITLEQKKAMEWNIAKPVSAPVEAKKSSFPQKEEKQLFESVLDEKVKQDFLKEVYQEAAKGILWTKSQTYKAHVEIARIDTTSKKVYLTYPHGMDAKKLQDTLRTLKVERFFLNFNIKKCCLFFDQPLDTIAFEKDTITLITPRLLYQVQRRTHYRLPFEFFEAPEILLSWRKPGDVSFNSQKYSLKDISAGGCCVYEQIETREIPFKQGQLIEIVKLNLVGKEIHCSAQVRWVRKINIANTQYTAAGLLFENIEKNDFEIIYLYVLEKAMSK